MIRRLLSLATLLLPTLALAGAPHLVRDVNTTPIPGNSIPSDFHDQGSYGVPERDTPRATSTLSR
jgi:hypothetical protein